MELIEAMKVVLGRGLDLERNQTHLYKRGTNLTVLQFDKHHATVVDETFPVDKADQAIARYFELVAPAQE